MASASRILLLNSVTLAGGFCSSSWLNTGIPSSSKVSRIAPSGTSSVAARNAARLYDPRRRLPAIPRIRIGVFILPSINSQRALDESKNARATPSSVFYRSRSLVTRYLKTRRGVEPCNWPEIAGNKQSTHRRLESFPVSTQHQPSRARPILDQVSQRLLLPEPPDACK